MIISVAALSDIGRVRSGNEDTYLVDRKHGLFVVADGMGGCHAGEVASQMAVALLQKEVETGSSNVNAFTGFSSHNAALLAKAVASANQAVHHASRSRDELSGMGTTIAAVMLDGYRLTIAHVGDSRVYLVRGQSIVRLTEDHSFVQEQQQAGKIDGQQACRHPLKHVLTRAVGPLPHIEPEIAETDLMGGDRLLLCSDGLTGAITDEELYALVSSGSDPAAICEQLICLANERGGEDNITVVTILLADESLLRRVISRIRR